MRALLGRGILVKSFIAEFLWNLLSRKKVVFVCEKLLVHVPAIKLNPNEVPETAKTAVTIVVSGA